MSTGPAGILRAAAAVFGCDVDALLSPRRRAAEVLRRDAVVLVLRRRGWTLHEVGDLLGRDHSSVVAAQQRAQRSAITLRWAERIEAAILDPDIRGEHEDHEAVEHASRWGMARYVAAR